MPSLSMNHLLVHENQDIKSRYQDKTKIQQYIQQNTEANEIQQLNPGGLDNRRNIRPKPSILHLHMTDVCNAYYWHESTNEPIAT